MSDKMAKWLNDYDNNDDNDVINYSGNDSIVIEGIVNYYDNNVNDINDINKKDKK